MSFKFQYNCYLSIAQIWLQAIAVDYERSKEGNIYSTEYNWAYIITLIQSCILLRGA